MNILNFDDDTDEVINQLESITSYNALCKIKELYEAVHRDVSCNKIYYTARKSVFETKFDITLSDGRKIGDITLKGDYDTIPEKIHEALIKGYKTQAEKVLSFLGDKIHLVEKDNKKSAIICCIIGAVMIGAVIMFYLLLLYLKNLL